MKTKLLPIPNATLFGRATLHTRTNPDGSYELTTLAQLYLRPTMTTIKSTDDTTNGYIIDTRPFL